LEIVPDITPDKVLLKHLPDTFFDGSPPSQVHGPGAIQFVGLALSEEKAATIGDRNLFTEVMISLNEEGT
jgi:hypothetical protein